MRNAVVGSTLLHVVLLAALFAFRANAQLIMAGSDIVQVSLIEPGAIRAPSPSPPPARAPEPVRERVVPQEDVGVKITPPAKPRTPEAEPAPRSEPTPETASPYVSIGPPGLRGSMSVDRGDFEFNYYLVIVRNRIAQNWTPPAGLVTGGQPVRGTIYFRIGRGGRLSQVRVESASAYPFFDRSTLRAVQLSDPMPPLPLGFSGSDLGVHFGFEYVSP